MGNVLNPVEILKIAVNVETNGQKFYAAMEKKADDEKTRATWRYLKDQESVHEKTFQNMLDNIDDYIIHESVPGEYEAYLKAIASEYIFTQKMVEEKARDAGISEKEAVNFAIRIEKESILTYSALREYILTSKQQVLDKVINEEKKHLADLAVLKSSL